MPNIIQQQEEVKKVEPIPAVVVEDLPPLHIEQANDDHGEDDQVFNNHKVIHEKKDVCKIVDEKKVNRKGMVATQNDDDVETLDRAVVPRIRAQTDSILQAKEDIRASYGRTSSEVATQDDDVEALDRGVAPRIRAQTDSILQAKEDIRASYGHTSTVVGAGTRNDNSNLPAHQDEQSTTMVTELADESSPNINTTDDDDVSEESFSPRADSALVIPAEVDGGIRAFVARDVVDAIGVTVITDDNNDADEEIVGNKDRKKVRMCLGLLLIAFVVVVVAVLVATLVVGGKTEEALDSSVAAASGPTAPPSLAPTSAELPPLVNCLSAVTSPEIFQNRESPQYQAADWLSTEDQYYITEEGENKVACDDPRFLQRYALATLYFSIGGPQWRGCGKSDPTCTYSSDKLGWLSNSDECDWYMLTCNTNNNMLEEVDMSYETTVVRPQGSLPLEMALLTEVVRFSADNQAFTGTIGEALSTWSKIEELVLDGNDFTGPLPLVMDIKNPALRVLALRDNLFSGKLASTIGNLSHLETLKVGNNRLTGGIPSALGRLTELTTLLLDNNKFEGEIPIEIYSLLKLSGLHVHNNNALQGTIPTQIGQLQNLADLSMGNSQIGGSLPEKLFTLAMLTNLSVENANFLGPLSPDFASLKILRILNLSNNNFTGSIPDVFHELQGLEELELHRNLLTGVISAAVCEVIEIGKPQLRGNGVQTMTVDCNIDCSCCDMWMECP